MRAARLDCKKRKGVGRAEKHEELLSRGAFGMSVPYTDTADRNPLIRRVGLLMTSSCVPSYGILLNDEDMTAEPIGTTSVCRQ